MFLSLVHTVFVRRRPSDNILTVMAWALQPYCDVLIIKCPIPMVHNSVHMGVVCSIMWIDKVSQTEAY